MQSLEKKNVVISGGSSGIGLAVAFEFAELDANIYLIARNESRLLNAVDSIAERNKSIIVKGFSCDVNNYGDLKIVINQIGNDYGGIDILINNAGSIQCGRFEDNEIGEMEQIFHTNYWGMVNSSRLALPWLKKSAHAAVGFVSSIAGYTGLFGYSHYAPSKFAIAGLAECLRMEFKDYLIGVTIIYPPDTQTPLLDYEHQNTLPECKALSKGAKIMSAKSVAKKFVKGIQNKKFEVLCNSEGRLIRVLKGLWPSLYYHIVDGIVVKSRRKANIK